MTRQGLFATGSAVEIAAVPLGDGVELRVGRATDSYHKVPKGELFVEAFRNDSFVMHAPLKPGTALATLGRPALSPGRKVQWGLVDDVSAVPENGGICVRVAVPEGVVWVELPT